MADFNRNPVRGGRQLTTASKTVNNRTNTKLEWDNETANTQIRNIGDGRLGFFLTNNDTSLFLFVVLAPTGFPVQTVTRDTAMYIISPNETRHIWAPSDTEVYVTNSASHPVNTITSKIIAIELYER